MIDYKKRILVLSSEFPPLPGGIGNHAYFLSKYLKKNGFEVTVVSDHRSEIEDIEFDALQQFNIFRIKRNKWTYFNRIKKAFYLAKRNQIMWNWVSIMMIRPLIIISMCITTGLMIISMPKP